MSDPVLVYLEQCHKLVWDFRSKHSAVWPTPDQRDAARFAVTEAAEVLDAALRLKGYSRNNEKVREIDAETADCAMMLLTTMGPEFNLAYSDQASRLRKNVFLWCYENDIWIDRLACQCADVLSSESISSDRIDNVLIALAWIYYRPNYDLITHLAGRLARIEARLEAQNVSG